MVSNMNVPPVGTSSRDWPLRSQVAIVPNSIVNAKTKRSLILKDLRPAKLKATKTKKTPPSIFFQPFSAF